MSVRVIITATHLQTGEKTLYSIQLPGFSTRAYARDVEELNQFFHRRHGRNAAERRNPRPNLTATHVYSERSEREFFATEQALAHLPIKDVETIDGFFEEIGYDLKSKAYVR